MTTATQTVEVRFKGTRKAFYTWNSADDPLRVTEPVIVEADRGHDFGRVSAVGETAARKCGTGCSGCAVGESESTPAPLRGIVRRATAEDVRTHNDVRRSEEDVRRKVIERVQSHDLLMKVSDTEWQWDRARLTIYFTAEKRVDFRTLVRDLATLFRTRIELRQIGVRDEAARLGGVGRCGREYCCSTWLKELSPVNLGLAKDQHLSLNPSQISGGCGRLLCCLKYEHDFYVASRKRFPKEGKSLRTALGIEKVVAVDIFRERVYLRGEGQASRIIPLVQLREELEAAVEPAGVGAARAETGAAPARPAGRSTERRAAERRPEAPAAAPPPLPSDETPAERPAAAEGAPEERRRSNRRRRRRGRRRSSGESPGESGSAGTETE
ncbi:MAG TPA: regulatory iron-sulfur-containing complex subunit RicT [Gemmatimonadales bacterium]|nr:regulatory iron-sulfur-containing complex subunit RicT [Gemmatimonadales bacterium]